MNALPETLRNLIPSSSSGAEGDPLPPRYFDETPSDIVGDRFTAPALRTKEEIAASQDLSELMRRMEIDGTMVAALRLAFEGLDAIRESLGVQATEWVLQIVAQRLSGLIGSGTLAARLGADEFLILACIKAPIDAHRLACDIEELVGVPVSVRGCDLLLAPLLEANFLPVDMQMELPLGDDTGQPIPSAKA